MAASAPIIVADNASAVTDATIIFNGRMDKCFVDLRAQRKDISKAITTFVNGQRELAALPAIRRLDFDVADQLDDCDHNRKDLIANLNNWVDAAHAKLDMNNHFDKSMIENIAGYVDRASLVIGGAPFFWDQLPETLERCRLYTRDAIVPCSSQDTLGKRKVQLDDSDLTLQGRPPNSRALDASAAVTSDESTVENVPEVQCAGSMLLPPQPQTFASRYGLRSRIRSPAPVPQPATNPQPEGDADDEHSMELNVRAAKLDIQENGSIEEEGERTARG